MRDAKGMRRAIAILVQPFKGDPVTRHRQIPVHLNRSGLNSTLLNVRPLLVSAVIRSVMWSL